MRPTGKVTPLSASTAAMAGPSSKKSTRMNVGGLPYSVLHSFAANPSWPSVTLAGEFVMFKEARSGVSMSNDPCL